MASALVTASGDDLTNTDDEMKVPPAAYVRLLLLNRLGFQAEHVSEIMDEIAHPPRAAACTNPASAKRKT